MDRASLQTVLKRTQARLVADRDAALATAGLPSGLAVLANDQLAALAAADDQDDVGELLGKAVGKEQRKILRGAMGNDRHARLQRLDEDELLKAACAALIRWLSDEPGLRDQLDRQMRLDVSTGGTASHNRQVQLVGNNNVYNEAPPDPAVAKQQQALLQYLRHTMRVCNALPIGPLDPTDADQRPMQLAHVYIGLHTTTEVKLTEAEKQKVKDRQELLSFDRQETRPLTAIEALQQAAAGRLLLRGAPGSGKSTFLNHLALCLAGAALCSRRAEEMQPPEGWLAVLPHWQGPALIPIRVILRDFAAFEPLGKAKHGSVRLLRDFVQTMLVEIDCADALEPLLAALADGTALLLLDGLDEVVGDPVLRLVAESIADAVRAYPSALMVTCRILDHEAEPLRQLPGFAVDTLADLTDDQIAQFVEDWYDELADSGRRAPTQTSDDAKALRDAIATRPELRDLGRLPLLLTVMALVHTSKGTLPDARALLYHECIDLLLVRWRQKAGETDLVTRLGLSQFRATDLLTLMAQLGYEAHRLAERRPGEQRPADLSESKIMELLADGFARYAYPRRYELAQTVLDALAAGNGLLLKRGPHVYAFPHRTFQEFLAGYHLAGQPNHLTHCLAHASQVHWHEALLLMVGHQVPSREMDKPLLLAEKLLERTSDEQALAGEILNLVGRERAAPALIAPGGLWPHARDVLLRLATQGQAPDAPTAVRVRAGFALSTLCYGNLAALAQHNAALPLPDPRLPLAAIGLPAQHASWWQHAWEEYWCPIAAGPFWYGDDREGALEQVELPYGYKLARYTVTNADYARFLAVGGYTDDRWWTPQGLQAREQYLAPVPRYWDDSRFNGPSQPVVGISWYEAAAYAQWITVQGHQAGWLPATDVIRLPTSLEWERAARHTDQRRYPWGPAEPDAERVNYQAAEIGRPTPVGCFPQGAVVGGAMDLAGNVMEWLATPEGTPQTMEPQKDFTPRDHALITYSDYTEQSENLCCGARVWNFPDYRYDYLGFRLVWSRALL